MEVFQIAQTSLLHRKNRNFLSLLDLASNPLKQRITYIDPSFQDEMIFQWQDDESSRQVKLWSGIFPGNENSAFYKRFDEQTLHAMIAFAHNDLLTKHYFVVLSWEPSSSASVSPWRYHNTVELKGQYETCLAGWLRSLAEAERTFELSDSKSSAAYGSNEDDDYWGSYGENVEEVASSQLTVEYVQKLAMSLSQQQQQQQQSLYDHPLPNNKPPQTVVSKFKEDSGIFGEEGRPRSRSGSGSPEKRRINSTDMAMEDSLGLGRAKRPILNFSNQNLPMSEKDIMKSLLKTNIQSLFGMARLSGISKAEFAEIVEKCCE